MDTPLALKPAPVALRPEIVTFAFPLFVSVVVSEVLVFTVTFPKLRLDGLALSDSVGATPVPLKLMVN